MGLILSEKSEFFIKNSLPKGLLFMTTVFYKEDIRRAND